MQFFYEEQLHRMKCMAQEPDEGYFTLHDLKGSKLARSVFNILFNLNKFMAFETRDPFLICQYIRLSMEEDAEEASNGSADVWD
ncbi:hypothetical protein HanPI659440_Chr15g0612111 [Helianthus annuus]|nr:hypothetical protein HanPI659440_Chr15g0612111 [Helianthus annuus]